MILGTFTGANATESTPPAPGVETSTLAEAREFLAEHGVTAETQNSLILSATRGERWDSMSSDSVPVSTDSYSAVDGDYTLNTYEDGSVSVTRLETQATSPGTQPDLRGISQCRVQGNLRSDCKIDTWVGLVAMSFYATYNLGTSTVNNVYGGDATIIGACSTSQLYLGRPAANIGLLQYAAQMCGVPYNDVFNLKLTVGGGNASVTWY